MNENREIYFGENTPDEDIKRLEEAFAAKPDEIKRRLEKLDEELRAKSIQERIAAFQKGASS